MASEKQFVNVEGIFKNESNWIMDYSRLLSLTSDEFADEILKEFNLHKGGNRFKAQVVRWSGTNPLGDYFERIAVSLGDSFRSNHYMFFSHDNTWIRTSITQDLFENIVKPFQKDIGWKMGDGFLNKVGKSLQKN